jgi:hypothetical protein
MDEEPIAAAVLAAALWLRAAPPMEADLTPQEIAAYLADHVKTLSRVYQAMLVALRHAAAPPSGDSPP